MLYLFVELEKTGLKEKCYLKVADVTLNNLTVLDLMSEIPKEICGVLPNTIITNYSKEHILFPTTTSTLAAFSTKMVRIFNLIDYDITIQSYFKASV